MGDASSLLSNINLEVILHMIKTDGALFIKTHYALICQTFELCHLVQFVILRNMYIQCQYIDIVLLAFEQSTGK